MRPSSIPFLLTLLCLRLGPAQAADVPCPGNPDALGTSRTVTIGDDAPRLGLKTYPHTLQLADHEVVLTFDDGPLRTTTPQVLAALDHECVRATFFLVGRNAAAAPDLVRQEIEAGDTVAYHSFSHPEITERGLSDGKARADIEKGFAAVDKAAYGASAPEPHVPMFRFPGFADTPALDAWLASRHIAVFGADLWASDWVPMSPEAELALLVHRLTASGRGIILLHDVKPQTALMLPAFLRSLKANGFRVVHMVPGAGPTPTVDAPSGWTSETEASLAHIMPRLLHAAKARSGTPKSPPARTVPDGSAAPPEAEPHKG